MAMLRIHHQQPRLAHAEAAIELLFPVAVWEQGGPDAHEAGQFIQDVRTAARGRGFAWAFPMAHLHRPGARWRLWADVATMRHFHEDGLFDRWRDQGVVVGRPQRALTQGHQGVCWRRHRLEPKGELSPSAFRRLNRHRQATGQAPVPWLTPDPARRPPIPAGMVHLRVPSHQRAQNGERPAASLWLGEQSRYRSGATWLGYVDSYGFAKGSEGLIVPDERYTAGLTWEAL